MLKFLRIFFTILSALALVAAPFVAIFYSMGALLIDLGVAAVFFFAMLLVKQKIDSQNE